MRSNLFAGFHAVALRLVAVGIAVLVIRDVAPGQGAPGEVPDPMGLREVNDLLDRYLEVGPSERLVVEAIHDDYLADFARIRDDEIAEFLEFGRVLRAPAGRAATNFMPSLDALKAYVESWRTAVLLVHRLDDRFFASLSASLGDDPTAGVERARLVRRRRANASSAMGGGILPDSGLDEAFWLIEPTVAEVAAVDDVLRGLEMAAPRLVESIAERSVEAVLEVAQQLSEAGYGDLSDEDMNGDGASSPDRERVQAMMEVISRVYAESMGKVLESREKLADREVDAARSLRGRLDPDRWVLVKRRWASRSFPEAGIQDSPFRPNVPRIARKVVELLTPESDDGAAVEEILTGWYRNDDMITDRMIEAGRATVRAMLEGMLSMGESGFEDSVLPLVESRTALGQRTIESLLVLLPEDLRTKLLAGEAIPVDTEESLRRIPGEGVVVAADAIPHEHPPSGPIEGSSQAVNPISIDELGTMLEILRLDEASRNIARSLHVDYLDDWSKGVTPILDRAAARTLWADGEAFGIEALAQCDDHRAAVGTAIELDDRLFADFAVAFGTAIPDHGLDAVRLQRIFDRSLASRPLRSEFLTSGPEPVEASPFEIIASLHFDPATRAIAEAALLPATAEILAAYDGIDLIRLAQARQEIVDSVDLNNAELDYEAFIQARFNRRILANAESDRRRLKTETALIEVVLPALAHRPVLELRMEMLDRALPIQRESASLDVVRRTLRLPELDSARMGRIEAVLLEHLVEEQKLIDRLQVLRLEMWRMPDVVAIEGGVRSTFDAEQARGQEIGKIVFRRNELRERLRQRVLATLSPEQVARVTGGG